MGLLDPLRPRPLPFMANRHRSSSSIADSLGPSVLTLTAPRLRIVLLFTNVGRSRHRIAPILVDGLRRAEARDMNFNKPVLVSLFSFFSASLLVATPSWESLGGSFAGRPFVVFGSDGRLEVFVRGTDNALWFAAQTSPGGSWTPFVSLGGVITSNPTAALDSYGRIAIFAVGDDTAVWMRAQITPRIDTYSDWTSIGGSSTSDVSVVQTPPSHATPTAYLFMRGPDNSLWFNRGNEVSGPWDGPWTSLGGYLASAPGAGANVNGQATVLVRGSDNALWYRQADSPGTITFTDWATLGGAMNGPPSVAEINGGFVLYRGQDNAAWFLRDTTPFAGSAVAPATWSNQASLGGYIISNPTMAPNHFPGNDLEVFVVGGDNALWVAASLGSGSPFGPWQSLGGFLVGDPSAARNEDGTVEVLAIGSDGALWHIRQSMASSWQ